MLITFSGLDGAGKSTLIEWVCGVFQEQHRRVVVFHMNDHIGVYAALRNARDRLLLHRRSLPGAPAAPAHATTRRMSANDGGPHVGAEAHPGTRTSPRTMLRHVRDAIVWNKPLRRCIYPFDLLVFWAYRLYHEGLRGRVLVMDRYFYDTLVDVADGRHWFWTRVLNRITPTPTVAVFLEISPEESFARKGEYTVEYLRKRWIGYGAVAPLVRSAVRIPNDDIATTKRVLRNVVMERLAS